MSNLSRGKFSFAVRNVCSAVAILLSSSIGVAAAQPNSLLEGGGVPTSQIQQLTPDTVPRFVGDTNVDDCKSVLFVLDCSRSMGDKLTKIETRMDRAKMLISKVVSVLPSDIECALRTFGEETPPGFECQSSKVRLEPKPGQRKKFFAELNDIKPHGSSPLTYALTKTFEDDLKRAPSPALVVLLSDGEDTCGYDPLAYVRTLESRGIRPQLWIVGLNESERNRARKAEYLMKIAHAAGGVYFSPEYSQPVITEFKALRNQSSLKQRLTLDEESQIKTNLLATARLQNTLDAFGSYKFQIDRIKKIYKEYGFAQRADDVLTVSKSATQMTRFLEILESLARKLEANGARKAEDALRADLAELRLCFRMALNARTQLEKSINPKTLEALDKGLKVDWSPASEPDTVETFN